LKSSFKFSDAVSNCTHYCIEFICHVISYFCFSASTDTTKAAQAYERIWETMESASNAEWKHFMQKMWEFQSDDSKDPAVKAALIEHRPLHFGQRQEAALHETFSVTVKAGYTFPGFNQDLKIPSGLALPPTPEDPFGAFEGWYISGTEDATGHQNRKFYGNIEYDIRKVLEDDTKHADSVNFIVSPVLIDPPPLPASTTSATSSNDTASNSGSTTGDAAGNSNVAAGDRLKLNRIAQLRRGDHRLELNPIAQAQKMRRLARDPILEGMSSYREQYRTSGTSGAVAKLYQEFGNVLAMSTDPKRGGWSDKEFVNFHRELNKGPEFLVKMLTDAPPAGCVFDCARRVNARILASQQKLLANPKLQAAYMCELAENQTTWDVIKGEYAKVLEMKGTWTNADWIAFYDGLSAG
jgi:hypothetical protein